MKFIVALFVVLAAVVSGNWSFFLFKWKNLIISYFFTFAWFFIFIAKEIWEGKKYKNYESTNFDEYLQEFGVGWIGRQFASSFLPVVELQKLPDGKYNLITSTTFRTTEQTFELDKEFDWKSMGGTQVKSTMTLEGNKLTHKIGGNPPSTVIREFGDKEMIATMIVNNVTCIRKYRVQD